MAKKKTNHDNFGTPRAKQLVLGNPHRSSEVDVGHMKHEAVNHKIGPHCVVINSSLRKH